MKRQRVTLAIVCFLIGAASWFGFVACTIEVPPPPWWEDPPFPQSPAEMGTPAPPAMGIAARAAGWECLSEPTTTLDTTRQCPDSTPSIKRGLGVDRFEWTNGREYLVINTGNNFELWEAEPPRQIGSSNFGISPPGDVDFGLMAVEVSDRSRYGTATFRQNSVLFDWGTGDTPVAPFGNRVHDHGSNAGGAVFTWGGVHYAVWSLWWGNPCPAGSSTVWRIDSLTEVTAIDCMPGLDIRAGIEVFHLSAGDVLYLNGGPSNTRWYAFRVDDSGPEIELDQVGSELPFRGARGRSSPLEIWDDRLLVADQFVGVDLYDIGDPILPFRTDRVQGGPWTIAAVGAEMGIAGRDGIQESEASWRIDGWTLAPVDTAFWDLSQPWNQGQGGTCKVATADAIFSTGGRLWLSRYSLQQHLVTDCGGPPPPTATPTRPPATPTPTRTQPPATATPPPTPTGCGQWEPCTPTPTWTKPPPTATKTPTPTPTPVCTCVEWFCPSPTPTNTPGLGTGGGGRNTAERGISAEIDARRGFNSG